MTHALQFVLTQVHTMFGYSVMTQEAKYVERWSNTTSAWAGWSRFDNPVDRYGREHSLLSAPAVYWGLLPATSTEKNAQL